MKTYVLTENQYITLLEAANANLRLKQELLAQREVLVTANDWYFVTQDCHFKKDETARRMKIIEIMNNPLSAE